MRISGSHPPLGGFEAELVGPPTLGWKTGVAGNADGTRFIDWGDVTPPLESITATPLAAKRELIVLGSVPDDLIGVGDGTALGNPGGTQGGYHCAYAGNTNGIWITIQDRTIFAADGINFINTNNVGRPVGSNNGTPQRSFSQKGAAHPTNSNYYAIFMREYGLFRTKTGATGFAKMDWCPVPGGLTYGYAWGVLAINPLNPSQVAACPGNGGVWLSSDGLDTGTNITGSSGVISVSSACWVNNVLFVVACDVNGNPFQKNLYKWTGSGTLTRVSTGLNGGADRYWKFIFADPSTTSGFFLTYDVTGDFCRSPDGVTFNEFLTNYNNNNLLYTTMKVKPRLAPLIADKFKRGFWESSLPAIVGGLILYPTGEGVLETPLANFPASWDGTFAGEPQWTERAGAGAVDGMLVGQQPLWSKDQLLIGSQDIAHSRDEDGRRGHKTPVEYYPHNLSDCNGMSKNPNFPGYVVSKMQRLGANNNSPQFAYTLNAHSFGDWTKLPPIGQFPTSPAGFQEPCHGVAGPLGVMWSFPCYVGNGARPQVTTNYGTTAPQNVRFWIGSTEQIYGFDDDTKVYGNQGATFAAVHHQVCYDWSTDRCWYVHLGSGLKSSGAGGWESDPNADAGLYATNPGDYVNFYRIKAGHPSPNLNRGYFDCDLIADGQGHLVWVPTYLPSQPFYQYNPARVYDMANNAWSDIANPQHVVSACIGSPYPGETKNCWWFIGWKSGATVAADYGLFYKPDIMASATYGPFASAEVQRHGFINRIAAQTDETGFKGEWGRLAGTIKSKGGKKFKWRLGV